MFRFYVRVLVLAFISTIVRISEASSQEDLHYLNAPTTLSSVAGLGSQNYLFDTIDEKLYLLTEGESQLSIRSVDKFNFTNQDYQTTEIAPLGARNLRSGVFNPKTKSFIFTGDENGDEKLNLYSFSPISRKLSRLSDVAYGVGRVISKGGKIVYFIARTNVNAGEHCIYQVSTEIRDGDSPKQSKIFCEPNGTQIMIFSNPVLNSDESLMTFTVKRPGDLVDQNLAFLDLKTRSYKTVLAPNPHRTSVSPVAFTKKGLLYLSNESGLKRGLYHLPTTLSNPVKIREITGFIDVRVVPETGKFLIFEQAAGDRDTRISLFDMTTGIEEWFLRVDSPLAYMGSPVLVGNGRYLVTSSFGEHRRVGAFLIDALSRNQRDHWRLVYDREKSVSRLSECVVSRTKYPTFDLDSNGRPRMIDTFIYTPKRSFSERAGVVLAHGGPSGAWLGPTSLNISELLCRYGYYSIAPNVRGSTGFGMAFENLNNNDWGGGDAVDYEFAGRFLSSQFHIPRSRIGIFGFSYGGYMAVWAATQSGKQNMFAFAIGGAPSTDLYIQASESNIPDNITTDMGDYRDPEVLRLYIERSPITHAKDLNIPLLMFHGSNDFRCPVRQTRIFYEEVKKTFSDVSYLELPNEGHSVKYRTNLLTVYQGILGLLERIVPITN